MRAAFQDGLNLLEQIEQAALLFERRTEQLLRGHVLEFV